MSNLSIGILELGYRINTDSLSAIQQIIDYACRADELRFSRFWLAEHHNPNIAATYTNPEILISLIAGMTNTIRVGSAGTLIKMYAPYNTVTSFKLMNNLFTNRIDLGLSKGGPGTEYTRTNLLNVKDPAQFDAKTAEIFSLLHHERENYEQREVVIPPYGGSVPEVWFLSNSYSKFSDAIKYKLNYCRSLIHGPGLLNCNYNKEELRVLKDRYYECNGFYPKVALAIGLVIADTMEEANYVYDTSFKPKETDNANTLVPVPVTIESLFEMIQSYRFLYGIDEFILYDMEGDNLKKIRNIERISEIFEMKRELTYDNSKESELL
jgi:luciferase family oxidoreductase group 1